MNEQHEVFDNGMAELGGTFMKEITEATMRAYWRALSDLSAVELERGFSAAIRTEKFWPPPARIRELGIMPKKAKIFE